jgi:cytoskeletal protein CcmA (bactofilin family)
MFGKQQRAMETIIGEGTCFTGELSSKGTIRIDGALEGRIRADWIIVGDSGAIAGNAVCRGVIVGGKIEGIVHAVELVDIRAKGSIPGEIHTARLAVSEGGAFEGQSYMSKAQEGERKGVLPFANEK